jgi:cell division protein FtsA
MSASRIAHFTEPLTNPTREQVRAHASKRQEDSVEEATVAIDVGTTKVCTLVAEPSQQADLRIVGIGVSASRGLRKGVVLDVDQATEAIADSVRKAEQVSGYAIDSAYVGVSGSHISGVNSRGIAAISRGERIIVQDDVDRAMEAATAIAIPPNREPLHAIPRGYLVDDQDGVRNPLGLRGFRLEVEAHIITGASASIHNLAECVQNVGVRVHHLIVQPIASGEAVLTEAEKDLGVAVVDIGGGTTDMAVFIDGSVWHTVVLPVGGNHLTHDLAVGLRTPFSVAETLKIRYGHAIPDEVGPDELLDSASFGDSPQRPVSRARLAEIIQARMEEILELVLREIKRSGYDGLLPAGVVLCGGTAELSSVKQLATDTLGLPVRIGIPHGLEGLVDSVSDPAHACGVGLLLWAMKYGPQFSPNGPGGRGMLGRLRRFLSALAPG